MSDSLAIQKAKAIIASVKSAAQSPEFHASKTIELAAILLEEAQRIQTKSEKKQQAELAGMMNDPNGKVFTTTITDQCFRSENPDRIVNQLEYVIRKYGVPEYLPFDKRLGLKVLAAVGKYFSKSAVSLTVQAIRQNTEAVILPGETLDLNQHLRKRRLEGVKVNLNHLGEAILGEGEAENRLKIYLQDLTNPEITYISVKISTLFSQISLLAWEETLNLLSDRLRQLYRAAIVNSIELPSGKKIPKFVNLDMEEYRDLHLTVALFKAVLDEPEFLQFSAGIVLQSYLPDSYEIQKELTQWAMERTKKGGSPIKIRIVKGANLAMERVEAAIKQWPQAPYPSKMEVDANFKRMVAYGCRPDHAKSVNLGIGSHNLFDIANALLLRSENGIENEVSFEMLEGMADHMRRVVQEVAGGILLYCPAATKEEFQNAIAYLMRRLDENTAPENFLRCAFDLKTYTKTWDDQAAQFRKAMEMQNTVSAHPRRSQSRLKESFTPSEKCCFTNEADTDWALSDNRIWAQQILHDWSQKGEIAVPLVIGGKKFFPEGDNGGKGIDPSKPSSTLFSYTLASSKQVDQMLKVAKESEKEWSNTSVEERAQMLAKIAMQLRKKRGDLIGAMVANTGKTVYEADVEISEAIDFAEYYRTSLLEWSSLKDISWSPKGTILVAPPWNFPCSISAGGILAALAGGNCVIFKPSIEAILVGWILVNIFWEAGVHQNVLQFLICEDEPVGTELLKDKRVNSVVLTGATATAQFFLKTRPSMDLIAETGGKNMMVITSLADRDLAIKDLIHSAFSHAGQKCSACSIAILEAELYDDIHFLNQLKDAAASMRVGSAWDLATRINPLICSPRATLKHGLTNLEPGESWLLEPKEDPSSPCLWSPGIKMGVTPKSFSFQNELFGPVLSLVRAKDFQQALDFIHRSPYGLTAGIHSLDEREQQAWLKKVEAGNCYINRTITGAVVQRQPFGGIKASSFGKGSKAGGPNYLIQFMHGTSTTVPKESEPLSVNLKKFHDQILRSKLLSKEEGEIFSESLSNYSFYYSHYFSKTQDPTQLLGQDNFFRYIPHDKLVFFIQPSEQWVDILRVIGAAILCKCPLQISCNDEERVASLDQFSFPGFTQVLYENQDAFIQRISSGHIKRIRLLKNAPDQVEEAMAQFVGHWNRDAVVANGRVELTHYFYEQSVSIDYHRYGNLGEREDEPRTPLIGTQNKQECYQKGCSCYD